MHHLSGALSDSLIYRLIKSKVDKPLHVCFFFVICQFLKKYLWNAIRVPKCSTTDQTIDQGVRARHFILNANRKMSHTD